MKNRRKRIGKRTDVDLTFGIEALERRATPAALVDTGAEVPDVEIVQNAVESEVDNTTIDLGDFVKSETTNSNPETPDANVPALFPVQELDDSQLSVAPIVGVETEVQSDTELGGNNDNVAYSTVPDSLEGGDGDAGDGGTGDSGGTGGTGG